MARIVVCGYMIRHPLAGNLLAYFHYVLGFARLGHQVAYVEESGWPYSCYDPTSRSWQDHPETGLQTVASLMKEHGLRDVPAFYVNPTTGRVDGGDWSELKRVLGAADLLLNVGGVCWLPEFMLCRRRALVDLDPLFTQTGKFAAHLLHEHDVHFSYGANIGRAGCTVPVAGVHWHATVPPVLTELWPAAHPPGGAAYTTVANWSAYGGISHNGEHYGQKDEEFLRIIDLPSRTRQRLEIALSGAGEDVCTRLRRAGWSVVDAGDDVGVKLSTYKAYVAGSRGEFSVAKNAYVKTRSGWFSDRSVCYLAAGLPVVVQDTGFGDWLHATHGVLQFADFDQAVQRLAEVDANYNAHRAGAVDVARRYFAHDIVLPALLDKALGISRATVPAEATP
jgi:hypothetical protein